MSHNKWHIQRVESSNGNVHFDVVEDRSLNVIVGGLVNRNEAGMIAAIPDMIEALEASQAFIKPVRRKGRETILELLEIALIKATG